MRLSLSLDIKIDASDIPLQIIVNVKFFPHQVTFLLIKLSFMIHLLYFILIEFIRVTLVNKATQVSIVQICNIIRMLHRALPTQSQVRFGHHLF